MAIDFSDWLNEQMRQRDLSQSELARMSKVSQSQISLVLNRDRKPGTDFCTAIAHALRLPTEDVFRAAGLLPPPPSNEPPTLAEWIEIFMQADEKTREDLLNYAQYRADQERKAKRRPANPLEQTVD